MNNSSDGETEGTRRALAPIGDEISLHDLWAALVRQRRWAITVWVLCVLGAAIYVALAPSIFESRSIVRFASFAGKIVDSPYPVKILLEEEYRVGQPKQKRPFLSRVSVKGSDAVELRAEAYSPMAAKSYLDAVTQKLAVAQQQRYAAAESGYKKNLADVQQRLGDKDRTIKSVNETNSGQTLAALLAEVQAPELLRLGAELRQQLSSPRTYGITITPPTLPTDPIAPRSILILGLATILGIILSVVVALSVDFVDRAKRRSSVS